MWVFSYRLSVRSCVCAGIGYDEVWVAISAPRVSGGSWAALGAPSEYYCAQGHARQLQGTPEFLLGIISVSATPRRDNVMAGP